MIAAWFMRFGSLELQTFSDVDDLADTLVMLDNADTSTFDQWGIFKDAVDTVTGKAIPQADIDAAEERAQAESAKERVEYVPPVYAATFWLKDAKGRWHRWMGVTSELDVQPYADRLAGLLADGRAEIRRPGVQA